MTAKNQPSKELKEVLESSKTIKNKDYSGAKLSASNLSGKIFENCNLDNANFFMSNMDGVIFDQCTLNNTRFDRIIGTPTLINCNKDGGLIVNYVFINMNCCFMSGFKTEKGGYYFFYTNINGGQDCEVGNVPTGLKRAIVRLLNESE